MTAYNPTIWTDRMVEFPDKFTIRFADGSTQTVTLTRDEGDIISEGTPVSAANLNKLETGVKNAQDRADFAVAYTDQQIQLVTETGIPKLVSYAYTLTATTDDQMFFDIPLATFEPSTDTVLVFQNRTALENTAFQVGDYNGDGVYSVQLVEGVKTGTRIALLILKNVPIGPEGSIHGQVIADGTLSLAKLDTDVATQAEFDGHINAADPHPQYALDTDLQAHVAAANPHPGYALKSGAVFTGDVRVDAGLLSKMRVQKSNKDANGIYTTVEYRRKADNKLFLKSVLSNSDSNGRWTVETWYVYAADGVTVADTVSWTITYDADGDILSVV